MNHGWQLHQYKVTGALQPANLTNHQTEMLTRANNGTLELPVHEVKNLHMYEGGRDGHHRDVVLNNTGKLVVMTNTQDFVKITKILRCGYRYYAVCQPLTRINDEHQQRFLVVAALLRNPEEQIVLDVSLLGRPVVYLSAGNTYTIISVPPSQQ